LAQGGIECTLTTNFRSHAGILDVVNGVFAPLIRPREGLQPDYVPIQSPKMEENDSGPEDEFSFRKVTFCRVESQKELKANLARRLEHRFVAQQDLVDGVNLLRAASHPYDQAALVWLLRSTISVLSDLEIYNLQRDRLIDYRLARHTGPDLAKKLDPVRYLYETLN